MAEPTPEQIEALLQCLRNIVSLDRDRDFGAVESVLCGVLRLPGLVPAAQVAEVVKAEREAIRAKVRQILGGYELNYLDQMEGAQGSEFTANEFAAQGMASVAAEIDTAIRERGEA